VRVELGDGPFSFRRRRMDADAAAFHAGVMSEGWVSESAPGSGVVWIALEESGQPGYPLAFALEQELQIVIESEQSRRDNVPAALLDENRLA